MKKALLLSVLVYLSAICVLGQQNGPPPAAPDYSPNEWKEYSFKQDNIRFLFPVEPKVTASANNNRTYEHKSFMEFSLNISDAGIDVGNLL